MKKRRAVLKHTVCLKQHHKKASSSWGLPLWCSLPLGANLPFCCSSCSSETAERFLGFFEKRTPEQEEAAGFFEESQEPLAVLGARSEHQSDSSANTRTAGNSTSRRRNGVFQKNPKRRTALEARVSETLCVSETAPWTNHSWGSFLRVLGVLGVLGASEWATIVFELCLFLLYMKFAEQCNCICTILCNL